MARTPRKNLDAEIRARTVVQNSTDAEELRIAQAVLLPASGLSLLVTGELIGRDRFWVARERNRFIRQLPTRANHGGRRRSYLEPEQEHQLVQRVFDRSERFSFAEANSSSLRELIREEVNRTTGNDVADSTITDILNRYTSNYIPGATWGELGTYQYLLQRLAFVALEVPKWRERLARSRQDKKPEC